jgi:hypothetical protein
MSSAFTILWARMEKLANKKFCEKFKVLWAEGHGRERIDGTYDHCSENISENMSLTLHLKGGCWKRQSGRREQWAAGLGSGGYSARMGQELQWGCVRGMRLVPRHQVLYVILRSGHVS